MRKLYKSILLMVALLAVSGVNQSVEEISAGLLSQAASVSVGDFFFIPPAVTINLGETVQWDNTGGLSHTTTASGGAWNSELLAPGGSFSHTFNSQGTFPYLCTVPGHAALGMVGTIIVVDVDGGESNALPTAFIGRPNFYATFQTNDSIVFSGLGNDAEDGNLIGASLAWTSNINGPIGTGESFTVSLSAGSHTITLTVTDSYGATGDAIKIINVTPPAGGEGGGGGPVSLVPTAVPTAEPTLVPTAEPTLTPTVVPTVMPTAAPTVVPSVVPTLTSTVVPTVMPTAAPTVVHTVMPSPERTRISSAGAGGGGSRVGATIKPVPTSAGTSVPAPPSAPLVSKATPGDSDGSALPAGVIVGIIAAVVTAMSALIYYDVRRRRTLFIR